MEAESWHWWCWCLIVELSGESDEDSPHHNSSLHSLHQTESRVQATDLQKGGGRCSTHIFHTPFLFGSATITAVRADDFILYLLSAVRSLCSWRPVGLWRRFILALQAFQSGENFFFCLIWILMCCFVSLGFWMTSYFCFTGFLSNASCNVTDWLQNFQVSSWRVIVLVSTVCCWIIEVNLACLPVDKEWFYFLSLGLLVYSPFPSIALLVNSILSCLLFLGVFHLVHKNWTI